MGILNHIINGLAFLWSLASLVLGFIADVFTIIATTFSQVFFSGTGAFLLSLLILWGAGAVITETHSEIIGAVDEGYCNAADVRSIFANLTAELANLIEIWICFYNLIVSWMTQLIIVFFELTIECGDGQAGLNWLDAAGKMILALTEALIGWLLDPFHNSFPFFSPQGAAAADFPFIAPDMKDVWHPFKNLVEETRPLTECLCEEVLLNDFLGFIYDRLEDDNLGCTIDRAINGALNLTQETANIILDGVPPDYTGGFSTVCQAVVCYGQWLDNILFAILEIFLGGNAFDLQLGCIYSRIWCVVIEAGSVLVDIVVNLIDTGDLVGTIGAADFAKIVQYMYQLADCIESLFGLVDVCLGQTMGNLVRLLPATTEFAVRVIQEGQFYFELLFDAIFQLVGNSRLDVSGASGAAGNHLEDDPECAPNCEHDNSMQQTSLTCLVSKILGDSECAQAFGDLTNAVIQAIMIPVLMVQEVLTTDYSSLSFDGNPLAAGSLDSFNDLILDIICVVTDRLILLLDYTGHMIECIPGLEGLGDAIVQASQALFDVIDDVKRLLLLAVEVLVQIFIWILTLFGASPFGGDAGEELINFFTLFADFFIEVFDLFLEIVKGLIDFVLFPWFPGIFGQGTLLSDDPGTARFTQCFEEFGDCICGITKTLADNICLPFSIGCLSGLWPDCDDFEPERRRQWFNATEDILGYTEDGIPIVGYHNDTGRPLLMPAKGEVFAYWAEQHSGSFCGEVFRRWADDGMAEFTDATTGLQHTSVGEQDGMELLNCIALVRSSVLATNGTEAPPDLFAHPQKMADAGHEFGRASALFMATESANLFYLYADPAAALGRPEANASYVRLESALADMGINNTVAVNSVLAIRDSVYNISGQVLLALNGTNESSTGFADQSYVTAYKIGQLANRALSVGVMTVQRMQAYGVMTKLRDGMWAAGNHLWGQAQQTARLREFEARQKAKREYTAGAQEWSMLQRLRNGYWFHHITPKDARMHKLRRWAKALREYGSHLSGYETISPLYDARGDAIADDHKPDSCTVIQTECDDNQGNGCAAQETLIANFRVCNDVFDHALVTNCQSVEGYQEFNFVTFDFYIELEECQLPNDERPPPDGNVCAFGPGPDLNETQIETMIPDLDPGFCGFGVPPNFNVTNFDVACWDTSEPPSTDNGAGFICITQYGCEACPVEQVIPGFECSFLDRVVHRLEYLTRRCIDKFGLGPPLPEIPDNITDWFFENIIIEESNVSTSSTCGNYRLENVSYTYRNPITREVFTFEGEACDPAGSMDLVLLPDANGSLVLTNATCGAACQWIRCGNGVVEMGEECDDGNTVNGDGCNALCKIEACGDGKLDSGGVCRSERSSGFFGRPCEIPVKVCISGDNVNDLCLFHTDCNNADEVDPCRTKPVFECVGGIDEGMDCAPEVNDSCTNGTCVDLTLDLCGGSPDDCEPREECDDGNILANDGCDRTCMLEHCPRIMYQDALLDGQPSPCPGNPNATELTGSLPETCFHLPPNLLDPANSSDALYSVEVNCKAGIPVLWAYENAICDGSGIENRVVENLITDECFPSGGGQPIVCTEQLFVEVGVECLLAVQTGVDFTCTQNCAVCGDGIVNGNEQCDDGSRFLTGDPAEDECVDCRNACSCHPDPHLPCIGQCFGGTLAGTPCDPRAPGVECPALAGDIAGCVAVECCGDGLIYAGENDGERCDRAIPPPINVSVEQLCVNCLEAECECQANKTCQGVCKSFDSFGTVRPLEVRDIFNVLKPVYCDMQLEPFACPGEENHCVPQFCCGDGVLQSDYENGGFIGGVDPCDPSTGDECFTPKPDTCGYLEPSDNITMLLAECVADDDEPELGGLEFGRRDACSCRLGRPCVGVCYSAYGDLISPEDPYFCDRSGESDFTAPYETLNWTRPGFGIVVDSGNAQCEAYGFAGALCGAVACCGNSPEAETAPNAEDLFADPRRALPCTDTHERATPEVPYEFAEADQGPCELGTGNISDALGCGIPRCQYDSRWFSNIFECVCQPGLPCVGRCSRRGDHTGILCDPTNASASPWCPYDSDPEYACHAVACCGDSKNQSAQGVSAPSNSVSGPLIELDLEQCDDSACVPSDDCGLDANLYSVGVYTQCTCLGGFDCGGACVDASGSIQDDFLVSDGPHCDASVDGGQQGPCAEGFVCTPQACCGDNFQHRWESCDNGGTNLTECNATCGLVLPAKRKRSVEPEEFDRVWSDNRPVAGGIAMRQAPSVVIDAKPGAQLNMNGPPLKDDVFLQWILDFWDSVLEALGFEDTGALAERVEQFFTNTDINILVPPKDRGFLWYLVFPFWCRAPENTSCELGLGFVDGLAAVLLYSGLFFGAMGIATYAFGSILTSWMIILYMYLALTIFLGVTFGYAFPGCFLPMPRLPECIGHELADVFFRLNDTCIEYPSGVVLVPADGSCPEDCERNITDCKAIGFIDGFDTLMYTLEVYFPDAAAAFRDSFLFDWLNDYEYFALTFERFNYGDDPVPEQDSWCYKVTWLNIAMIPALLLAFSLTAYAIWSIFIRLIDRFAFVFVRGETFVRVWGDERRRREEAY